MHRDRLCRYGFELFELMCKQFQTKLLVYSTNEDESEHKSSEQELSEDLLSIVNIFVARNNGKRAYKNKKRRNGKKKQEEGKEHPSESKIKKPKTDQGTSPENMESETLPQQRTEGETQSDDGNLRIHL